MIDMEQIVTEIKSVEARRVSLKVQIDGLNKELDAIKNRISDLSCEYDNLSTWERALRYRYAMLTKTLFPGDGTLDP